MFYLELLKGAISVLGSSILFAVLAYALIFLVLVIVNRSYVKTAWFIVCSVIFLPFAFVQLSLYSATKKIEQGIVPSAYSYACSLANKVDTYSASAPGTINDAVGRAVSDEVENVKKKYADKITSIVKEKRDNLDNLVEHAEKYGLDSLGVNTELLAESVNVVDSFSNAAVEMAVATTNAVIDEAAGMITKTTGQVITETMPLHPVNIVDELKDKYPALSMFITDKGIEGDTNEEVINSIFDKIYSAIESFKTRRLLSIIRFALLFMVLSLFFGWRKQKREAKEKPACNQPVQETAEAKDTTES